MLRYLLPLFACTAFIISCQIEPAPRTTTGAVYISVSDSGGQPIERAQISVDGSLTSQRTPAIVSGLTVGSHTIEIDRQDIFTLTDTVDIVVDDTLHESLVSRYRPLGAVALEGAPDGTILILNNSAADTTPPNVLFVGIGDHLATFYLPGYATGLPARWPITVSIGDTVHLDAGAHLIPTAEGNQPGTLAPVFALPDDRDSSIYRLQDYRGRVVLITFFYTNCDPCVAEMQAVLVPVYADPQYSGQVEFFGIDPNDPYFQFSLFRNVYHPELGVQFPLLYAQNLGVREAYDVSQFPTNLLIDRTGTIRYRWGQISSATQLRQAIDALLGVNP